MDVQQQRFKRRKIPWGRWLIVLIVLLLVIGASALWIRVSQGSWISILPVLILTVMGLIITLFQWLFPISLEPPANPQQVSPVQVPTIPLQQITGPLPSPGKTTYRSLVALPPPTDARTIQQRETSVQQVYAQLLEQDITAVVLTGIGGVGKSTLAALVYRYAEEQRRSGKGRFTAKALWLKIDSAAVTMADLVGTIFDALGQPIPDVSTLAPHNQAATLLNALDAVTEPRLIVLDQFENLLDWQTGHALPDRPGVGEWLDALNSQPCTCRILLTSRPWPQGTRSYPPTYMQEYSVKGLALAEGIELLRKLGITASEGELRQAVERCTGHAFALTLLASLLRNRNLSLGTFFKDTSHAQLWTGNVARNLLDQIYSQQLDATQRKLLLAFCVYREPAPLEAARAIADPDSTIPRARLQQAVDALLAQHLLQPSGEGLFQLHTIVIGFANDHFVEHDEKANQQALQAAHACAAHYYRQYAAKYGPPRARRRQSSDVQPLVEAIWQLCQAEQWQEAYSLMRQERLHSDLHRWGNSSILLEMYQQLLPLQKWQPGDAQSARIYNSLGEVYRRLGQMEDARLCFEQALEYSRTAKDPIEEGCALNNIGRFYADTGNKRQALLYYEEALAVHEKIGNPRGKSFVLANMGWVYYDLALMDKALQKYEEALLIHRQMQDRSEEARALNSIGRLYLNLGQVEKARLYHEQVLSICREIADRNIEAWTLNNLGRVQESLGDKQKALDYLNQALSIRREIGNRGGESSTLNNLAIIYGELGQYEKAQKYFEQALHLRREVGNRNGEAKTLYSMGKLYMEMGQAQQALPLFKQVIRMRHEMGQRKHEAKTISRLGQCALDLGHHDLALACFLLCQDLLDPLQSTDPDATRRRQETQDHIDNLAKKLGEEPFTTLKAQVEPQAAQIVEQELQA